MTVLLAIRGWDQKAWQQRFQRLLPDRSVVLAGDAFDPASVRYVACWKHEPGSLAALSRVEVLFSLGAGVDHLVSDSRLPLAPIVRVVDDDLTHRMTEWVVWQCLDWLRQGKMYRRQQMDGRWSDDRHQPSARDVRVGVMGLGVLGRDAIEKLQALRFDVAGWSRSPRQIAGIPAFSGQDGLTVFLARTDMLVVLMPLTDETRGMIDRKLLGGLAGDGRLGGPVLINAGRGGLQVESDILTMLDRGSLKGASLDVFETEPLPAQSPFWKHPQVIVTPHNAAMSEPDAIAAAIVKQIYAHESGSALVNVVDPKRGY
jgi:glyoxylate/hydroxypyruvate reductase